MRHSEDSQARPQEIFRHAAELYQSARALLPSDRAAELAVKRAYSSSPGTRSCDGCGSGNRTRLFAALFEQIRLSSDGGLRDSSPDMEHELFAALRGMPLESASVLLLADVHRFGRQEVSAIMGCAEEVVPLRLSSARKDLRGVLACGVLCWNEKSRHSGIEYSGAAPAQG